MKRELLKTSSLYRGALIATGLLFLGACATPPIAEVPTSAPLPAVEKPYPFQVGYKRETKRQDGRANFITVIEVTADTVTWQSDGGCTHTRPHDNFAPSIKWTGCTTNGTHEYELIEGQPYPIKVGNAWRYKVSGQNDTGGKWDTTRSCKVEGEAQVTVPMGTYDTFKVVCRDTWRVRTWYISPELGQSVFFSNSRPQQNEIWTHELVRIEQGGS